MSPVSAHAPPHATPEANAGARCCVHAQQRAQAALNPAASATHGVHAAPLSLPRLTTAATLHCLTGCAIGEFIGLSLGVSLGLAPMATMLLATVLGFVSGFTLGLRPLLKQGMGLATAFKAIWLGETISIAVMELTMNLADFHVGGLVAPSMLSPTFWLGYAVALPAGFLAAWPVNYLLLRSRIKKPCH